MPSPNLDRLCGAGVLHAEPPAADEFAGLLRSGLARLLDALPHYHLDYQEQLSADPEQRWSHRITVDGKWAPNLFNFYYRVYLRLVEGLDVPFKLDP